MTLFSKIILVDCFEYFYRSLKNNLIIWRILDLKQALLMYELEKIKNLVKNDKVFFYE